MEKNTVSPAKDDTSARPPIVAVMGHVDHGKTTLLDNIRKTRVATAELGGITQQIGAYQVTFNNRKITFIDTPGHEAFTLMRSRSGSVADLVIVVIAADEGVKTQTKEVLDLVRTAKIPFLIALNKIDRPEVNVARVKEQLAEAGILVEDCGGQIVCVEISAKDGRNIDHLLEMVLLMADLLELKADVSGPFDGFIVEAKMDQKRGPLATVIVRNGKLRAGEAVWAGNTSGKVKALFNPQGKSLLEALPSDPVELLGFSRVPNAGLAVTTEKPGEVDAVPKEDITLSNFRRTDAEAGQLSLNLILHADTQGALEALRGSLIRLATPTASLNIIFSATGEPTASDVFLARDQGAIIVCFNLKTPGPVKDLAEENKVEIRTYGIIYELIKEIDFALKGLLSSGSTKENSSAEVLKIFPLSSGDLVAGCRIISGRLKVGDKAKIYRNNEVYHEGRIKNIKVKRERVSQAEEGSECGLIIFPPAEIKIGDRIEVIRAV